MLLVKPSALGDVVHALPVATLLKKRWPACRLDWLVSRPFAPLLEAHPAVDHVVPFDRRRGDSTAAQFGEVRRLASTLRDEEYDVAIDLQGLFRSGWLARRSGAAVRVGLASAREMAPLFYTHRVDDTARGPRHAIDRYLDVAEAFGCGRGPIDFALTTTDDDEVAVDQMLQGIGGRFAVLLPGTNWPTKRWPSDHFASLAERLRRELKLSIVIAGSEDARAASEAIESDLSLVGRTSVRELIALLRRASLVVSNDSGPMHLAAALGRPLVAPFGPTDPVRTGPFHAAAGVVRLDLACSPCFSRSCVHQTCLRDLSPDVVLDACRGVLAS